MFTYTSLLSPIATCRLTAFLGLILCTHAACFYPLLLHLLDSSLPPVSCLISPMLSPPPPHLWGLHDKAHSSFSPPRDFISLSQLQERLSLERSEEVSRPLPPHTPLTGRPLGGGGKEGEGWTCCKDFICILS